MPRKSLRMREVEREYGKSLEVLIPELVNVSNQSETAELFGISKATLGYWMLKLGIRMARKATLPGEILQVAKIS